MLIRLILNSISLQLSDLQRQRDQDAAEGRGGRNQQMDGGVDHH